MKVILLVLIIVVGLLILGSWTIQEKLSENARVEVGRSLISVRDTTHLAVKTWFKEQTAAALVWANSPEIRGSARRLLAIPPNTSALLNSPAQQELRDWFRPLQQLTDYRGYFIVGPNHINLASSRDQNVGIKNLLVTQEDFLAGIWANKPAVSLPHKSDVPLIDKHGQLVSDVISMFVAAPIHNDAGEVIAIFMFRLDPEEGFTNILKQGRIGRTGESYAFDKQGLLISQSRFDETLRELGLVTAEESGILNIQLRDPGVNLVEGKEAMLPRRQQPLTYMAQSAIRGETGFDLDGYRDYRGVPVVGAWLWDNELGLGLTTELDMHEAYQSFRATQLTILTFTIFTLFLLIGLTVIYIIYRQLKQTNEALRESEVRFRMLVENIGQDYLIYQQALDEHYLYLSPAIERFTGVSLSDALGRKVDELFNITPETKQRLDEYLARLEKGELIESYEETYLHPDMSLRTVEVTERPEIDESGNTISILGIVKDITERKKFEDELRRAATVFENTDEGIIVTNAKMEIIMVNKSFTTITGYKSEEVLGKNPRFQQSGQHDVAFYKKMWDEIMNHGQWRGEIWNQRKNGDIYPAWENINVVKDQKGHITNYVSIFSDISVLKDSEARLAHLAHHDTLTDLPNRLRFAAVLEQAIERAKRYQQKVALIYLDLDRFKLINDTLGHHVGDQLLKIIAQRLKACIRAEDSVARLGGDEFTVVLTEITKIEDAGLIANKIIEAVRKPMIIDGQSLDISASLGISIFPDDAVDFEGMVKAADDAMYRAKSRGKNDYQFFTAKLA